MGKKFYSAMNIGLKINPVKSARYQDRLKKKKKSSSMQISHYQSTRVITLDVITCMLMNMESTENVTVSLQLFKVRRQ